MHKSSLPVILLLLFFFTGILSCKKYLDATPDNSLAVPSTISDLQALLDFTTTMNLTRTPNFGEASCDDYFLLEKTFNRFVEDKQNMYIWRRHDYVFPNDWSIAYEPVYLANFALDQLGQTGRTPGNASQWDNVKGSALFYRSFYFSQLLWTFAAGYDKQTSSTDAGIVLRMGADFNVPSVRSSVGDCYAQIIADTKEAVVSLPDHPLVLTRPDKAAALGLLARVYLSMREYDSAWQYADRCLALKSDLIDFNGDDDLNGDVLAEVPFKRFNKETIFYCEMSSTSFINDPYYARVDTLLYSSYSSNDLRRSAYFLPNGDYQQFKGNYTGDGYMLFTGLATDEMYMIRAECAARSGKVVDALSDLNTLLEKRWDNHVPYVAVSAGSAADAVDLILAERRKELYARGLRWMDLKRLNKEGRNIVLTRNIVGQVYTLQPNDRYYALPLPVDIIQLTGIPQN